MTELAEAPMGADGVDGDGRNYVGYLVLLGLVLLMVMIVFVVISSLSAEDKPPAVSPERAAKLRHLPVYWTVHAGDSYGLIAEKTGLTVDELETFNPLVDPTSIVPGQRLKLRAKVPKPKPKPLGPKYVTLHSGDSFGSVAAKTGKDITKLMRLNPKLKPTKLQPGDRLRLR